jgi:archaellum biogenesis ATPase FlaH
MASKDYSTDLQKLFLEIMLADAQSFIRVQNIFDPVNFDKSLRSAAAFLQDYSKKYNDLPNTDQVKAEAAVELQKIEKLEDSMISWFMDEFESFTRHETLKRVILKSADLIEKGEYDPIEKLVKDAVQISLTRDLGLDYFDDPRARLMKLKDNNGQMTTGWPNLDRKLFGGFNRGELEIFAGGSGAGKSLFMQNLAVNWMTVGLDGVYVTLELSEELCAMRIDSMLTNVPSKEIFKDLDTVEMKVKMVGKKAGSLRIKYMPAQSNVNDLRSYLKELQIQTGRKASYICVDYLDLLMPVSAKVSPSDLFVKDKYVSEELRNLAKEMDLVLVTASQLNRSAVEEIEFDHSHISGGISKINTADNVFGIFTSRSMKEHGRYQLQLMKTRSSSGVGQKVDLEFDQDSLRIRDLAEDQEFQQFKKQSSSIFDSIKNKTSVAPNTDAVPAGETGKITADVQSTKLKQMLNNLKAGG